MAMITQAEMDNIRKSLDKIDANVKSAIHAVIERTFAESEDRLRQSILEEIAPICSQAASVSSEVAQAVFNAWREGAIGETLDTIAAADIWDEGKFAAATNTAVKAAQDGKSIDEVCNILATRSSYDNKRAYGQTMLANCKADPRKPRYARVPGLSDHYSGGCPFCRMLASRGFVYYTKKTAGDTELDPDHYHADCTCQVVCSWDETPVAENYEPAEYLEEYNTARRYAEANIAKLREREEVGEKTHIRYKNGTAVGTRKAHYDTARHVQAYDMAAAYRDLDIAEKHYPDKN